MITDKMMFDTLSKWVAQIVQSEVAGLKEEIAELKAEIIGLKQVAAQAKEEVFTEEPAEIEEVIPEILEEVEEVIPEAEEVAEIEVAEDNEPLYIEGEKNSMEELMAQLDSECIPFDELIVQLEAECMPHDELIAQLDAEEEKCKTRSIARSKPRPDYREMTEKEKKQWEKEFIAQEQKDYLYDRSAYESWKSEKQIDAEIARGEKRRRELKPQQYTAKQFLRARDLVRNIFGEPETKKDDGLADIDKVLNGYFYGDIA